MCYNVLHITLMGDKMEVTDLVKEVNLKFKQGYSSIAKIERALGYGKDSIRQRLKRNNYIFDKELKQFVLSNNTNNIENDNIDNTNVTNSIEKYNTDNNIEKYNINNIDNIKRCNIDNTNVINSSTDVYNPVNNNTGGKKLMTLEEFKKLKTIEQVNFVNKYADGKKTLSEIEKEYFEFTNVSKYVKREEAYWDKQKKIYVYIGTKNNVFTTEEIMFVKQLYKQHIIAQNLADIIQEEDKKNIVTRSIRVDKDTIQAFAKFCKDNNIIQSTAIKIALEDFMNKQK